MLYSHVGSDVSATSQLLYVYVGTSLLRTYIWSICMNLVHLEVLAVFGPYLFSKMIY